MLNAMLTLTPCHPIAGTYTDYWKRKTYIVDDFGVAIAVFARPSLVEAWIEHVVHRTTVEH